MQAGDRVRGTLTTKRVSPTGKILGDQEVSFDGVVISVDDDKAVATIEIRGTRVTVPQASLTVTEAAKLPPPPRTPSEVISPAELLARRTTDTPLFQTVRERLEGKVRGRVPEIVVVDEPEPEPVTKPD